MHNIFISGTEQFIACFQGSRFPSKRSIFIRLCQFPSRCNLDHCIQSSPNIAHDNNLSTLVVLHKCIHILNKIRISLSRLHIQSRHNHSLHIIPARISSRDSKQGNILCPLCMLIFKIHCQADIQKKSTFFHFCESLILIDCLQLFPRQICIHDWPDSIRHTTLGCHNQHGSINLFVGCSNPSLHGWIEDKPLHHLFQLLIFIFLLTSKQECFGRRNMSHRRVLPDCMTMVVHLSRTTTTTTQWL
mmetsp:Transcript_11496/g.22974  ORF Transcript_11496/g.22974 Transcript_11496/m.22974 type:complete len:245 (-) Transcript_11496:169-903(-)